MERNEGITLVALVVTIIVLLILVGVTVGVTLGPNGVINKAKESKLESRYASIKDKISLRDTALKMAFEKNKEGESRQSFVNRLMAEGLLFEGEYDKTNYTPITLSDINGTPKYVFNLPDGGQQGLEVYHLMNTLESLDSNSEKKHLTLRIRVTNPANPVDMPIQNATGITIDWGDGTETPFSTDNPTHTYAEAKDYIAKIKGRTEHSNATFGRYSWSYKNTNIVELIYWGENNFKYIHNLGGNLTNKIPEPTSKSFESLKGMYGTFVANFSSIGSLPENLFVGAPNLTSLTSVFAQCYGLTGSIPEKLFINNSLLKIFSHTFYYCRYITGSIPAGLFKYNYEAENFCATFFYCTGLEGNIPQTLFDNCTKVKSFGYYTSGSPERGTFKNCTNLTGPAIPLWSKYPSITIPQRTYEGCVNLDGYTTGAIPDNWK